MKNIFSISVITLIFFIVSCSQSTENLDENNLKKSSGENNSTFGGENQVDSKNLNNNASLDLSDTMKIKLTPYVPQYEGIEASGIKLLKDRLNAGITKVGFGGDGANPRLIIGPSINILTQDVTSTAPTKYACTYEINFMVVDIVSETVFNSYKQEFKGVGDSPEKAFISGARNIDLNNQNFIDFLLESERKIIAYFEDNCSTFLSEAESEASMRNYDQAFSILKSIPKEAQQCFNTVQAKKTEFFQMSLNVNCAELLSKMRAELGKYNDPSASGFNAEAMSYYSMIDAQSDCYNEAQEEYKAYVSKLKPESKRDWDQKMVEYKDQLEMLKQDKQFAQEEVRMGYAYKTKVAELEAKAEIEGNKKLLAKYKYDDTPWLVKLFTKKDF